MSMFHSVPGVPRGKMERFARLFLSVLKYFFSQRNRHLFNQISNHFR